MCACEDMRLVTNVHVVVADFLGGHNAGEREGEDRDKACDGQWQDVCTPVGRHDD